MTINGERIDIEGDYKRLDEICLSDISFTYKDRKAVLEMDIRLQKLRGNTQNTDRYNELIVPDNGDSFLRFLLNSKRNFVNQIYKN